MYCLNIKTSILSRKNDMHLKRYAHGCCYINEYIYVAGGAYTMDRGLSNCERYNIIGNEWEHIPNLNREKYGVSIVAMDNRFIYVFGGKDINDSSKINEGKSSFMEVSKLDTNSMH
jgi:hypothetical protein